MKFEVGIGHDDKVIAAVRTAHVRVRMVIIRPVFAINKVAKLIRMSQFQANADDPATFTVTLQWVSPTVPVVEVPDKVNRVCPDGAWQAELYMGT
jgi:hypothetical protein